MNKSNITGEEKMAGIVPGQFIGVVASPENKRAAGERLLRRWADEGAQPITTDAASALALARDELTLIVLRDLVERGEVRRDGVLWVMTELGRARADKIPRPVKNISPKETVYCAENAWEIMTTLAAGRPVSVVLTSAYSGTFAVVLGEGKTCRLNNLENIHDAGWVEIINSRGESITPELIRRDGAEVILTRRGRRVVAAVEAGHPRHARGGRPRDGWQG